MIARSVFILVVAVYPQLLGGQAASQLPIRASEATPIGALPPVALPMPARRDHD